MAVRWKRALALLLCACAVAAAPAPASAEENIWTDVWSVLPGVVPQPNSTGFDPQSHNVCLAGDVLCAESVSRQMEQRLQPQARTCQHSALFALAYLYVTNSAISTPVDFTDRAFIYHQVWVFSGYYFAAYDAWSTGDRTPAPVWKLALDSARAETVPAGTDLMLGFIAHIQRDLPFVLYRIGLTMPDGRSRKPDHDRVNQFLYPVMGPMLDEMARRFDPTITGQSDTLPGTSIDSDALFELIVSWREQAWRDAEALAAAPTAALRAVVAQDIEEKAYSYALAYKTATQYPPGSKAAAVRDAYCAEHWNDT